MDYNEYLEKHSESIFHYCLPAKPGTSVLIRNPWSAKEEYLPGVVIGYSIFEDGTFVRIRQEKIGSRYYPITEFSKTIFIGSVVEE